MAIEVIREGDKTPPHYFLKCQSCHSVLRFTSCDITTYPMREDKEGEDRIPMITISYDIYLRCPICGGENLLPNSQHQWATSEEELDK